MRLLYALFLAVLPWTGSLRAQTTALPPGTSLPDAEFTASPPSAASLVSKAEDEILRGGDDRALPLLKDALAKLPANSTKAARALYDRGYIEQAQHQNAAAEADFHKAVAADPKQFESHAALGVLLAQQEQWSAARHELELASGLKPASGEPAVAFAGVDRTLARVDAQLHDPAAASDALISALKLTPEQPEDTFLAAHLAEDENNYGGAAQEYQKLLQADPKSITAAEGLARALIHQGKEAEAEPVLRQALQQAPNDPVLLAESATALASEGKTSAAIAQMETLHQQNPDQPAVTRMLADLYSNGGEADKAAPLYQQLLGANPKDPDLLTAAGENMVREQKWSEAVDTFQESLNLQQDQGDAWSGLAFAASQDQRYGLVLNALDCRAQYLADGPATLFLRANALDHLHRASQAAPYYRKFISAAQGKYPAEETQARERLAAIGKTH